MMKRRKKSNQRQLGFQTLERKCLMAGDLTNPVDALDVNADHQVSAIDALAIINYMNRQNSSAEGEAISANTTLYPDANGDGEVTANDALRVINRLAEGEEIIGIDEIAIDINNVSFSGGRSPRFEANVSNAVVTVTSPSSGLLTFSAVGMQETISIEQDLRIKVNGNGNQLNFNDAIIPDDLIIGFSGNNNEVVLSNTFVGDDFIYEGGGGSDVVLLQNGTVIDDNARIDGEDGNDDLIINGARVNDDFFFYGKDGVDRLVVDGFVVGDDAIVRLGDGNDQASVANTFVDDVADIEGDRGADAIFADLGSVTARRLRPDEFEAAIDQILIATIVF